MCQLKVNAANGECWGAEWRWPQNVSWGCISYCSVSLFNAAVCIITFKALCSSELRFLSIVYCYGISQEGDEIKKAWKALWLFVERMEAHYMETSWTFGRPRSSFWEQWGSLSFWGDYRSRQHNLPAAIATATRAAERRGDARRHITVLGCYCVRRRACELRGDERNEMRRSDRRQSQWTPVIDGGNVVWLRTNRLTSGLMLEMTAGSGSPAQLLKGRLSTIKNKGGWNCCTSLQQWRDTDDRTASASWSWGFFSWWGYSQRLLWQPCPCFFKDIRRLFLISLTLHHRCQILLRETIQCHRIIQIFKWRVNTELHDESWRTNIACNKMRSSQMLCCAWEAKIFSDTLRAVDYIISQYNSLYNRHNSII